MMTPHCLPCCCKVVVMQLPYMIGVIWNDRYGLPMQSSNGPWFVSRTKRVWPWEDANRHCVCAQKRKREVTLNGCLFPVLAAFNLNCVRSMGLKQQQFVFDSAWTLMLLTTWTNVVNLNSGFFDVSVHQYIPSPGRGHEFAGQCREQMVYSLFDPPPCPEMNPSCLELGVRKNMFPVYVAFETPSYTSPLCRKPLRGVLPQSRCTFGFSVPICI
jgi:hypothetical protein